MRVCEIRRKHNSLRKSLTCPNYTPPPSRYCRVWLTLSLFFKLNRTTKLVRTKKQIIFKCCNENVLSQPALPPPPSCPLPPQARPRPSARCPLVRRPPQAVFSTACGGSDGIARQAESTVYEDMLLVILILDDDDKKHHTASYVSLERENEK